MGNVLPDLSRWVTDVVYSFGYFGVAALIALQNLFPPIPSALILPLAGFLVGQGRFSFFAVLLAATTGSVISALILYALGRWIGEERLRKLVGRFGRFALVEEPELDKALDWFGRYGRSYRSSRPGGRNPHFGSGRPRAHASITVCNLHCARHRPLERRVHRPGMGAGCPVAARAAVLAYL